MASVALVTDSTADIPREVRDKLDIAMVPLKVSFGEETFLDNITLQPAEFYEKLTSFSGLPKTSTPSPADYYEVFKRLVDEGRTVISVHLSSGVSGTYQSALIAQSMLEGEGDVTVIDSKSASYGYGNQVVAAAEMAQKGASKEEIIEKIHFLRKEMQLYFLVDTLEYLQKGGRIGKASAVLGSLLNIKPILSIDDEGTVFPVEKVRGQKRAMSRITELVDTHFKGGPVDVTLALTPGHTAGAAEFAEMLKNQLNVKRYLTTDIGPVIGTHAGPGTIGLFVTPSI